MNKVKIIVSDCHLSAGLNFESERNPHEDFFYDEEMVAFFDFFSCGDYGGGREVELIINGDYLDFLNVPYRGEFEEVITEQFSLYKLECILSGHPKVVNALRRFAATPGKTILYNIGNHDADFFFPKVRERFIRAIDPEGKYPSSKVRVNYENPAIDLGGGVQLHHGNQFEASHTFNYEQPIMTEDMPLPALNIPWGSFYVLKIVNRLKGDRDYVDKVRPVKAMILWGLLFDTWFTLRFLFLSGFYFMKTRFIYSPQAKSRLRVTLDMMKQELTTFLLDLEAEARALLESQPDVHTVIFGHTHIPMHKTYSDGKNYINTGTWTRMVNLELRSIGQGVRLTFAMVEYDHEGNGIGSLQQWFGDHRPYRRFS